MVSKYFHADYYLQRNPDVANALGWTAEAAEHHYLAYGASEALAGAVTRAPNPWFDIRYYSDNNPDLARAGLDGGGLFSHFINYGINEGRSPSTQVGQITNDQLQAYASANPDLLAAFGIQNPDQLTSGQKEDLLHHYFAYGYKESRDNSLFDPYGPAPAPEPVDPPFVPPEDAFVVLGTNGNDVINFDMGDEASQGAVFIDAMGGDDVLNVAMEHVYPGHLYLQGGPGNDVFAFGNTIFAGNVGNASSLERLQFSQVTITDFSAGHDIITLEGFAGFAAQETVDAAVARGTDLMDVVANIIVDAGVEDTDGITGVRTYNMFHDWAAFQFEGSTYLFNGQYEDNISSLDGSYGVWGVLVEIMGVPALDGGNVMNAVV